MGAETLSHAMESQYSFTIYDELLELILKVQVAFKDILDTPDHLSQLSAAELLQNIDSTSLSLTDSRPALGLIRTTKDLWNR